ncbi:MAG: DUF3795 domain-containing protein [Anaerolineae bacterium]|nr:DUF3795 domain-containing protein [Anaerolineae bacterium]
MLGYCGIDCDACSAYKGTVTTDLSLLEKVAGRYWQGTYSASEWVCLGCLPPDQAIIAKYCARCKIRACAIARGLQNCAACDDYEGCSQLHDFIRGEDPALVQRMSLLRQRFLQRREEGASSG